MGLRSMLFALGLGTLWGGCRTPVGRLLDSARAVGEFSPDGREIYLLAPHRMYAWDLESRRIARERNIPQAEAGITFSPGGAFAVLAAQEKEERRAAIVLLRARDWETILSRELTDAKVSDHWYTHETSHVFAATDDGLWLAAFHLDTREVEIVGSDGRTALRAPVPGLFRSLAFNVRGDGLFASSEAESKFLVQVFALSGGKWAETPALEGAFHPAWTARGLTFGTSRGIEIREGGQRRVVIPQEPFFPLKPDAAETPWRFSPDGNLCLRWNQAAFSLHDTTSGATIAKREVDTGRTSAVWAAAFAAGAVRAFLATGELVEVDLASRSISRRASFGRPGSFSRNWMQEGGSWDAKYDLLLSPTGRHVALRKPGADYELYFTE